MTGCSRRLTLGEICTAHPLLPLQFASTRLVSYGTAVVYVYTSTGAGGNAARWLCRITGRASSKQPVSRTYLVLMLSQRHIKECMHIHTRLLPPTSLHFLGPSRRSTAQFPRKHWRYCMWLCCQSRCFQSHVTHDSVQAREPQRLSLTRI